MEFKFIKRVFFVGPKIHKVMISLPENANNAINALAEQSGKTAQEIIYEALEQVLVNLASQGHIQPPDEETPLGLPNSRQK